MALLTSIKFRLIHNRPIDDLKTSPGTFTIVIEDQEIPFDFCTLCGDCDWNDPHVALYREDELDTEVFPESYQLTYEYMSAHPFSIVETRFDLNAYSADVEATIDLDSVEFIFSNGKMIKYADVTHPVADYRLLFKVEGYVEVEVASDWKENALQEARRKIGEMDFGKLKNIDWSYVRFLGKEE